LPSETRSQNPKTSFALIKRVQRRFIHSCSKRKIEPIYQEITRNSPNGIPTEAAELFQEVFDELSVRMRLAIQELKDGTYQVNVQIPGHPLHHAAKSDFSSIEAAQGWVHSDLGNAVIRAIISKHEAPDGR